MAPKLRRKGDPPPVYGVSGEEFTVEVHHGGFFLGSGHTRSYVDEKISWFDHCEVETWSVLWFEDIAEQLGYPKSATFKVYWLLPGKTLEDGLRIISTDSDTNAMCSVVDRVQNLVLYFDHDDMLVDVHWDDVVVNPVSHLPKVISPVKVHYAESRQSEKLPEFYQGLPNLNNLESEFGEGRKEDSEGSEFVDSEYEVEQGDDDLPEGILEEEQDRQQKVSKSKKARGSRLKGERTLAAPQDVEELSSEEYLELPAEEIESEVNMKFGTFRAEDMNNPTFKVGMVFDCVQTLRAAITEYSLKQRVDIKFARNDKERFRAHCNEGCPWNLYASYDSRVKAFVVKTYSGSHNCQKDWNLKRCTANWLAGKYLESFRANDKMSIANFSRTVQKEWNLTPSRTKLTRARRLAMQKVHGEEGEQYNELWDYGNEIRRSNPLNSFFLNVDNGYFSTCYMSLAACKRGFLAGCRPLICLDGCHIKTKFGGQILTAVGIDPNDCIYPIAIAVVEVESKATWKWFLQTLKEDLGIVNTYPWTVMTDKQKGLIPAVQDVFPESEHRFCVRHLYSNFRDTGFKGEILKNQLWTCARASTEEKWKYHMEKMRALNSDAFTWLEKMAPNTWVRAFFAEFPKCDILLNNSCEVFNNYILEAREMPILSMFEKIKQKLMTRFCSKQEECKHFVGPICPKIRQKVLKNAEFANTCYALPSGQGVFQVLEREFQYIVDLGAKSCECRKWNITGIPCKHAISCLRHERIPVESVVHECYSIQAFNKAYESNIMPCRDKTTWEKVNGPPVLPPKYEKKVGRPPRCRKKDPHEIQGTNGPKLSKHGVTMTCGYCRGENHNARGCPLKKMGIRPEDYVPDEVPLQQAGPYNCTQEPSQSFQYVSPDALESSRFVSQDTSQSLQFVSQDAPQSSQFASQENPHTNQYFSQAPQSMGMMAHLSSTMLLQMLEQGSKTPAYFAQTPTPLPESAFITSNTTMPRPAVLTTATKEGKAATRKRKPAPAKKKEAPGKK